MTTKEPLLEVGEVGDTTGCVVCGELLETAGCCSFACVRDARRQLDANLRRLRRLQAGDGPTETRQRLIDRNGQLTAALMGWQR